MPDVRDARSAAMLGKARAMEWSEEFRAKWQAPDDETRLVAWWRSMPEQMHMMMAELNPSAHAKFEAFIRSLEEKRQWHK